jgi:L-threonylcarbamoyladenylate synthase
MAIISDSISEARKYLQTEVIGIPTETVYGLAANAFDANLVARIFEVKERPKFDPLIIHTYSITEVIKFVKSFPDELMLIAEKFWPGPLTILLPRKAIIPDIVTSGLENVAVRIPNHPLTLELLKSLEFPLAAPSANPFGYISPTKASHVQDQLGSKIPFILDGGPSKIGVESTIIGYDEGALTIFRLGGISVEEIIKFSGNIRIKTHSSNPLAPGMIDSHYAPGKRMILGNLDTLIQKHYSENPIVICYDKLLNQYPDEMQIVLSPDSDVRQAATNLFASLRQADLMANSLILAEPVPDEGLGKAINDRLRRAAF